MMLAVTWPLAAQNKERVWVSDDLLVRTPSASTSATLRFLENRVADDPLDFLSANKLASMYLTRLERDGGHDNLSKASALATASIRNFPAEVNPDGLFLLARVALASHQFDEAAQHALRLLELPGDNREAQLILADAMVETGLYDKADKALRAFERKRDRSPGAQVAVENRRGRLAWLHGRVKAAEKHYARALVAAGKLAGGGDIVAWCHWQIGTVAFARGDLRVAADQQTQALTASPGYARAIAALAEVRGAEGHHKRAIQLLERALNLSAHMRWVGELGDLQTLVGDDLEAAASYRRAERIGLDQDESHAVDGDHTNSHRHDEVGEHAHTAHLPHQDEPGHKHDGTVWPDHYGRDLALFYADHDLRPAWALRIAMHEYETRKDIYTADALAWAALKARDVALSTTTMTRALRLGTPDPRLYYHGAVIARAAGDERLAQRRLARVFSLNPMFDVVHGPMARRMKTPRGNGSLIR